MQWPGNETDLAPHIRPLFRTLVPMCIDFGISVAIVTFSGQIDLIRRLLIRELPPGIGEKIAIRGRDSSWAWAGTRGKQAFMASAAQELSETMAITITDKSTVLVDDDVNNIAIAIENGIPAVAYDVRNELRYAQPLLFNLTLPE